MDRKVEYLFLKMVRWRCLNHLPSNDTSRISLQSSKAWRRNNERSMGCLLPRKRSSCFSVLWQTPPPPHTHTHAHTLALGTVSGLLIGWDQNTALPLTIIYAFCILIGSPRTSRVELFLCNLVLLRTDLPRIPYAGYDARDWETSLFSGQDQYCDRCRYDKNFPRYILLA